MTILKMIILPMAFLSILLQPLLGIQANEKNQAEQIIQAYMDAKGFFIKSGTEDYKIFMREIFLG